MKVVADENIPLVEHFFKCADQIVRKPGRLIAAADVQDADFLLVRSVTPVNKALLQNSSVKFVGSTTAGFDHLDVAYLNQNAIPWSIAKGCNAMAVVEYVLSVVAILQLQKKLPARPKAAVIGVGEIGSLVSANLKALGFEVIECDPVRAQAEKEFASVPLEAIADVDFITIHTPLTRTEVFPTYHMIDQAFLQRQKPGAILLNTSRGSVIDFDDLKQYGNHLVWCLDVWEREPTIDLEILEKAFLATPHIAGYSLHSKYRGIEMVYEAAVRQGILSKEDSQPDYPLKKSKLDASIATWQEVLLAVYDPRVTTQEMKTALLQKKNTFDALRKNFTERYELDYVQFIC